MPRDWVEKGDTARDEDKPEETHQSTPSLSSIGKDAFRGVGEEGSDVEPESDSPETQVVGSPGHDAQFWHEQRYGDTCAIAVQNGILEKHTGEEWTEEALREEAQENGWYAPGHGTKQPDLGKLLDAHDVPTTHRSRAGLESLRNELEQGHDVMAAVDAGYLWKDPSAIGEGHAVWVTGLEIDQTEQVAGVFLNDTGNPDIGAGGRVPAEDFRRSWAQRANSMVSTQDAAYAHHNAGEDYDV